MKKITVVEFMVTKAASATYTPLIPTQNSHRLLHKLKADKPNNWRILDYLSRGRLATFLFTILFLFLPSFHLICSLPY